MTQKQAKAKAIQLLGKKAEIDDALKEYNQLEAELLEYHKTSGDCAFHENVTIEDKVTKGRTTLKATDDSLTDKAQKDELVSYMTGKFPYFKKYLEVKPNTKRIASDYEKNEELRRMMEEASVKIQTTEDKTIPVLKIKESA